MKRYFFGRRAVGFVLLVTGCSLLAGCATPLRFAVETVRVSESAQSPESYALTVHGNDTVALRDAKATMTCMQTALASKGLYEAKAGAVADVVVAVDVGVGLPRRRLIAKSQPLLYAQAWPTNRDIVLDPVAMERPIQRDAQGFAVEWVEVIEREKFLHVSCRENGIAVPARELWSVEVVNNDASDSLETYVPLLVAAAMDALAPASTTSKSVQITHDDPRLALMRAHK